MKFLLRALIFVIIFKGVLQAFVTYAVVPDKYLNETYSAEEVKAIAYQERNAGINWLYQNSFSNGMAFTILGILTGIDIWISEKSKNPHVEASSR